VIKLIKVMPFVYADACAFYPYPAGNEGIPGRRRAAPSAQIGLAALCAMA
jgi:hypothetical protein